MKNKFIVIFFYLLILFLAETVQSQDISQIKGSFEQVIQQELESLQSWGEDEKANPEKTITHYKLSNDWHAFYEDYFTYSYDIQKTNSIVSPYIGIVTFTGHRFKKVGNTKLECLNAEWKEVGKSTPTLKYSYQDSIWVLKEVPPVYKKH